MGCCLLEARLSAGSALRCSCNKTRGALRCRCDENKPKQDDRKSVTGSTGEGRMARTVSNGPGGDSPPDNLFQPAVAESPGRNATTAENAAKAIGKGSEVVAWEIPKHPAAAHSRNAAEPTLDTVSPRSRVGKGGRVLLPQPETSGGAGDEERNEPEPNEAFLGAASTPIKTKVEAPGSGTRSARIPRGKAKPARRAEEAGSYNDWWESQCTTPHPWKQWGKARTNALWRATHLGAVAQTWTHTSSVADHVPKRTQQQNTEAWSPGGAPRRYPEPG